MGLAALKIEDLPHYTYDDYAQCMSRGQVFIFPGKPLLPLPVLHH